MRIVLFISVICMSLLSSCDSNEKPIKRKKERSSAYSDSVSLVILKDDFILEDSISFNNLINEIVLNKELNSNNEVPSTFVSNRIYKFVYQTPDSIIPLSRKMDLLQMLVYFYRHTTNHYIDFLSSKMDENRDEVRERPFLLFPFIYTDKVSPSIIKCVLDQDSIQVPKEYFEYSCQVKKYLSVLPQNDLKEAVKKIKTNIYVQNPNTRQFLSKDFQEKYDHLPGWTIR